MDTPVTIEEFEARQTEIRARLEEIDTEHAGLALADDVRSEWNELNTELDTNETLISELRARRERVEALSGVERQTEEPPQFHTRTQRARGDDIYDLSTVRFNANSLDQMTRELSDRAKTAVEQATFPHEAAAMRHEDMQGHVERLLKTVDDEHGTLARRILVTGSPVYQRAFAKKIAGRPLSTEEDRALSTTTTAGGFAVPFALDPTVVPTSNHSVNPYRAISSIKTITVEKWEGVTSAGVTAAYSAEATEASDNAPTLAQPTVTPPKAQAFIPFSIEIGEDWGALQSEMAKLIQDAKDDLEADRFTFGTASTPEPEGIVKGGTAFLNTAATATFAVADVYSLETALPPRFRPRASFVGNRAVYNKIRQFDTAGGAQLFVQNLQLGLANQVPTPGLLGASLLGYGAGEASAMSTATTTSSTDILVFGDFGYFIIVDRIGMSIELIPHLFGGSNRYPTGQRGLYAHWRTGSVVSSTNAFRKLRVL